MKKTLFLGAFALAALLFMACPAEDDGANPDGPYTPDGWATGIEDFDVQPGDNPGEIKYKLSAATVTGGTVSYTLYWVPGSIDEADKIIAGAMVVKSFVSVQPESEAKPISNESGFLQDLTYSFVVVAKSGTLRDARSAVKTAKAKKPEITESGVLTLKVTGLPSGILGATLYTDSIEEAPVAFALNTGGTFVFVEVGEDGPEFDKVFKERGEYYIRLETSLAGSGTRYDYIDSNSQEPKKADFNTSATFSTPWGTSANPNFKLVVEGTQLTLTVTGIPAAANIVIAMLFSETNSDTPVAYKTTIGGATQPWAFLKVETMTGVMGSPTGSTPFTEAGSYKIMLSTISQKTYSYHDAAGNPIAYDFSANATPTIAWTSFADGTPVSVPDIQLTIVNPPSGSSNIFLFDQTGFGELSAGMTGQGGAGFSLESIPNIAKASGEVSVGGVYLIKGSAPDFSTTGTYFIVLVDMVKAMTGDYSGVYVSFGQRGAVDYGAVPHTFAGLTTTPIAFIAFDPTDQLSALTATFAGFSVLMQ